LFLLEIALLELAVIVGIIVVGLAWLVGWIVWLVWSLFYLAWAGPPKESYDVDTWPIRQDPPQ
jgi:hypothetical protein